MYSILYIPEGNFVEQYKDNSELDYDNRHVYRFSNELQAFMEFYPITSPKWNPGIDIPIYYTSLGIIKVKYKIQAWFLLNKIIKRYKNTVSKSMFEIVKL